MGLTKVTVEIRDLAKRRKPYADLFLVDTGATDCLAPASKLLKAGIKPEGRSVYELAAGTPVEYDYGFARISFMGAETVAQVIFGPKITGTGAGLTVIDKEAESPGSLHLFNPFTQIFPETAAILISTLILVVPAPLVIVNPGGIVHTYFTAWRSGGIE